MQIKNNIILFFLVIFNLCFLNNNLSAEEFDISATEISFDNENNVLTGKGSVLVTDKQGRVIKANKVEYEKSKEFLTIKGMVEISDTLGNILTADEATYDKFKEEITTYGDSKLKIKEGYELKTRNIFYKIKERLISSKEKSIFTDSEGNIVTTEMFQYIAKEDLFSSIGKIKIIDANNNKYFFKELHVDTKKKEMIGSDVSVLLDQENFGVSEKSDPRFVANDIFISENQSNLSKGIFTVCKKKDGKCPPWSLKAKKIKHDKAKKTIYYEHATLRVYNVPIFYFPKFFHPDPTVKRQSGFLVPFFTNSTSVGTGFALPYYWAISDDKDLTFTAKTYAKENILLLNEYRQAFRNGFLTLDTSYTEGYKNTSSTKTEGSRNHIFAMMDFNFNEDETYENKLSLKIQKTSNDTYFRIHDINSSLVKSENTDLTNEIAYNFSKDNSYLNITGTVHENLREKTNSRYEFILPNVLYGKTFFTKRFGSIDFKSNLYYKNYEVNKHESMFANDLIWNPSTYITKNGFVNSIKAMLNNTNYDAKRASKYKTDNPVHEISGVMSYKTSLPMKKESSNFSNIFSPNIMFRYAPGHMRNLSSESLTLKYANLFDTNKTSVIEDGLSAILGFDFKTHKKENDGSEIEKLSISMGQVFNKEKNNDIPSRSSLDQKMSDVVGEINYNFSNIGNIGYKFSLDHNFNDLNYNEVSTTLNFNKIEFNLDYLEERNHIGSEHYISSGIDLNINKNNRLSFATKKNFNTESTELYDVSYQYTIDCLTAGLVYRREFYEDTDLEQKNSLMFMITFVPFGGVETPTYNP